MSQLLPTHGFRFLQQDELETLGELSDDAEDGYIFEVDLSYAHHLHDSHDDYPLGRESFEIGRDMYSPAQRAVFPDTALPICGIKSSIATWTYTSNWVV